MLGLVDGVAADGIVVVTATGDIVVGRYDMGLADGSDVGAFDEVVGEDEALGPLVGKALGPLVGKALGLIDGAVFVVGRYDMGVAVNWADGSDVGAFEVAVVVGLDEALGPFVGNTLDFVGPAVVEGLEVGATVVGDIESGREGESEG